MEEVFILSYDHGLGISIMGVFSTLEKAEAYKKKLSTPNEDGNISYEAENLAVGDYAIDVEEE
jgi:hypothetical protein